MQILAILEMAGILPADLVSLCMLQQRRCALPSAGQESTSCLQRCWVQLCHGMQQALLVKVRALASKTSILPAGSTLHMETGTL